ncbi:MAG: hypothetical protein BTN85_1200 [Candidatus Methanohalarchaeum thermophilum]|uniref:Uncharacterized protein n=1 Tax=Methanohalarchaeum thermophilum TaxID=1903181 RepID=A0A1Q6DWI4_METT1|nr:MAG: hypothetical protein BTN85_1200 [Candidatus Methanohalarchaeum thermophilum]
MDIKNQFDAEVEIKKSREKAYYLVKKKRSVKYPDFINSLFSYITKDELIIKHPVGIAILVISHEKADLLRKQSNIEKIGPIHINTEILSQWIIK